MNEVTLGSFFRTDRTVFTTAVNKERKLVKVPPFEVPIDYSPNSGKRLGILVEQGSTNHFPDSEYMGSSVQKSSNITLSNKSIVDSPKSAVFPNGRSASAYIGSNVNINSSHVAVSFYIMQSNLQRPKLLYSDNMGSVFSIYLNDMEINIASVEVSIQGPMNDLSYRVRVLIPTYGKKITNIKIKNSPRSTIGFSIARIQFEPEVWTAYIATNGSPVTRPAETIYRNLTHGIDFNENQGTYDVMFSAVPNAKGSAATVLKDDWSEYMAIGHQSDENGYKEALRFHTSSTFIPVPLRYHEPTIGERYTIIRACFSGYGARGIVRNNPYIGKLKAYDSFYNGKFNRIQFGASYDGSHFTGHIHMINAYARTFDDEEMRNLPYIPNEDSLDEDYDLDESTVFSTAAAVFRTDKEALLYQNVVEPPTPQRILAAWPRASSYRYFPDPSRIPPTNDPANTWSAGRWYYNGSLDAFVQPINSEQVEQIFSPIKLDTYEFECTMYADPTTPGYWHDDDGVGLIAAADVYDGDLVSLLVMSHSGGLGTKKFSIELIDSSSGRNPKLWSSQNTITGNNVLYTRKTPSGGRTGLYCRIKITRMGAFLSAKVTQWNDLENYQDDYELVVNMRDLPGKGRLLAENPARYGFVSFSNTGSTYLDYVIRSDQAINDLKIYSEESNKYWLFIDGAWRLQDTTAVEDLLPATRISNIKTKENYIIDDESGLLEFNRGSEITRKEGKVTVSKNKTTDIPYSQIADQFEYEEEQLYLMNTYDVKGVIVEQIILDEKQYIRVVAGDVNGSFYALISTESQTDSFGITQETIAFRKINVEVV